MEAIAKRPLDTDARSLLPGLEEPRRSGRPAGRPAGRLSQAVIETILMQAAQPAGRPAKPSQPASQLALGLGSEVAVAGGASWLASCPARFYYDFIRKIGVPRTSQDFPGPPRTS